MMKRPHSPLTVGIDARTSLHVNTAGRGWGVYACELMRALQSFTETRFYCLVPDNELTRDLEREFRPFSHIVFRRVPYEIQTPNTYWSGAVTDFPEYWLGEVDVYHCLNRFLPPTNYEKGLVTIHDIAPLAARPSRSHLESATRAALSQIREKRFSVYTVSHATRRELSPYLDGDRVTTIHSGIKKVFGGPISIRRSDSKMILAVGGAGPNKNLANLVAAVARLRQRVPCRLYLAGAREWGTANFFAGRRRPRG